MARGERNTFLDTLRATYASPRNSPTRDDLKASLGEMRAYRAHIIEELDKVDEIEDPVEKDIAKRQALYKMRIG